MPTNPFHLVAATDRAGAGLVAGRPTAPVTVLPDSNNQTIGNLNIQAAGGDMHLSTINFAFHYSPAAKQALTTLKRKGVRTQGPMQPVPRRSTLLSITSFCQTVFNCLFCGGGRAGGGIDIVPLESDGAVDLPLSFLPTLPDLYVRALLKTGHGLPCWEPTPRQMNIRLEGIVPGDVGTYTVDRSFKKLFNLWDDEDTIRALAGTYSAGAYRPLQGRTTSEPVLQEGEALREGAHQKSHLTTSSAAEPAVVHEFHCHSTSGAILVLTAPADLFVTDDKDAMQLYIVQHIEAIYRHAVSIRPLGERESLYVVTGCIKNESWAIAAYNEEMHPLDNVLELVRIPPSPQVDPDAGPMHQWTKKGTARARVGASSRPGLRDQALFLQGFKIAVTPRFRSRVAASLLESNKVSSSPIGGSSHGGNGDPLTPDPDEEEGGAGQREDSEVLGASNLGSWSLTLNGIESMSKVTLHPADVATVAGGEHSITEFPRPPKIGYHPSDSINAQILEKTSGEVAICHDDDWRFLFKSCMAEFGSGNRAAASLSEDRRLCIKNGVAFVLSTTCDEAQLIQQSKVEEQSATTVPVTQARRAYMHGTAAYGTARTHYVTSTPFGGIVVNTDQYYSSPEPIVTDLPPPHTGDTPGGSPLDPRAGRPSYHEGYGLDVLPLDSE